jgi:hypothetical protein
MILRVLFRLVGVSSITGSMVDGRWSMFSVLVARRGVSLAVGRLGRRRWLSGVEYNGVRFRSQICSPICAPDPYGSSIYDSSIR